jgi:protein translocase SecG subunit
LGGIGGQARLFGSSKGLEQGLDKITTASAVLFILFSIILGVTNV